MSVPISNRNSVSYFSLKNDPLLCSNSRPHFSCSPLSTASSSSSSSSVPLLLSNISESKDQNNNNDNSLIFERNVEKTPLFINKPCFTTGNNNMNNRIKHRNSSHNSLCHISNNSNSNISSLSYSHPYSHSYSYSTTPTTAFTSNPNYIYNCTNTNTNSTVTSQINHISNSNNNNNSNLSLSSIETHHKFENYIPPNLDEMGDLVTDTDKNLEDINLKYGSNRPASTIGLNIALRYNNTSSTNSTSSNYSFTKRSLSYPYINAIPSNESIKDYELPLCQNNLEGNQEELNGHRLIELCSYADILYNEINQPKLMKPRFPPVTRKTTTPTTMSLYTYPQYPGKNHNNNNNNYTVPKQFHIESSGEEEEEEDKGD